MDGEGERASQERQPPIANPLAGNGLGVRAARLPAPAAVVTVAPMASAFIADTSLEFVAHRLVFLGYDVTTMRGARLEELFAAARREGRTVLTLSARHPRRFADVAAVVMPRGDAEGAVRAIAQAHAPSGPPFSRCAPCNQALHVRHPIEARGEVPGRVLRSASALHYCPSCGKWYWEGSHVARLRAWLERALGRAIGGPAAGPATPGS
jgi:hypothetical protein